ncbi:MAG: DUF2723 domain-containing protein [Candidatus Aminicenantes bacterium]|nr:DUF2723 domain-containing protein [Candidatus Aminicenantes bacterium]
MKRIACSGRFSNLVILLLFIAIALLYFSFLPVNYSFDGTVFSHFLRYALLKHDWPAVTQIHHLLYFPANYLLYRGLEVVFHYRVLEFFHLQLFSMFFGVLTLVLVERMLKKINLSAALRLIGVSAVAFSYSFWLYAIDAEVHMPGVFFALAGLYLLVFHDHKTVAFPLAALCFVLSAGFHLTNVLIVASAFFYLLQKRTPWRRQLQFLLACLSFGLIFYGAYAALARKPVLRIIYNIFFGPNVYSGYRSISFHAPGLPTFITSLAGLQRALLVKAGIWTTLISAVFLVLLALACKSAVQPVRSAFKRAMLLWFVPFFLFFSFWDSGNIEFKIHAVVPLLLIAITVLDDLKPFIANAIGVFLAGALLWINFSSGILPLNDIKRNTNYQVALAIQKQVPTKGQIVITGNPPGYAFGKIYLPYFALREVLVLDWLLGKGNSLAAIRDRLGNNAAAGRPIYALGEVVETNDALKKLLAFHHINEGDYFRFCASLRPSLVSSLPGGFRLYRLEITVR